MNYRNIYENLVNSRKLLNRSRGDGDFYEKHHIIPKSCGGDNSKQNLVFLTFKEHFIAHLLLTKLYEGDLKRKMYCALWMLSRTGHRNIKRTLTASQYQVCKWSQKMWGYGRVVTEETKQKISKANKGKKHPHSEETKELLRKKMKGWVLGDKEKRKQTRATNKREISEETRQKMKDRKLGRKLTEETKKLMSESHKKKILTPEARKKMSEGGKIGGKFKKK
jgi:hypothetical protein